MASVVSTHFVLRLLFALSLFHISLATRKLNELVQNQPNTLMQYHNGPLLSGKIQINLVWYGKFKPSQRAIIADFVTSLTSSQSNSQPSVATWWKTTEKYYHLTKPRKHPSLSLSLGKQILDESYSLGKSLTQKQIVRLASKGDQRNAVNVVLTASDVTVDGFCMSRCGTHGSSKGAQIDGKTYKVCLYLGRKLGDPVPGPMRVAVPPAHLRPTKPGLDRAEQRRGPGRDGDQLSGSIGRDRHKPVRKRVLSGPRRPSPRGRLCLPRYNAHGSNGRKYLVPALFDPATSSCSTMV
ncbi:phosphate-responsive 1 family protein [Actinidia rufa]|uniref:Phosphate-responsive 1 family protein n=1 Tax=Actinidia rufa TaxID=165716 RepID=A0A7J0GHJ8_9ERIC|nr:phosphate-responsive 1 family protein [Actinidia rufa]